VTNRKATAEAAETAERILLFEKTVLCALCVLCGSLFVDAQEAPRATRLAVLQVEDRRAPTPKDLGVLRAGTRSGDDQTARAAVRALGRLERPALIPDILPALRHPVSEIRSEAANAVGQAAQGWKGDKPPTAATVDAAFAPLVARLKVEAEPDVRAAICEAIGRMPYATAAQAESAERAIVEMAGRAETVTDRLGVAKALEAFARTQRLLRAPGDDTIALLRRLVTPGVDAAVGARIRRLSLEALIAAAAVDVNALGTAAHDPDPQVRRIAMRAAAPQASPGVGASEAHGVLSPGRADDSPSVRIEALRGLRARNDAEACPAAVEAVADRDTSVALVALDQLAACGAQADAVAALERAVGDPPSAAGPRAWHRAAHALVALATASPDRAAPALAAFTASPTWQLRMYAARAAAQLASREALDALARDDDDNVREAAVEGLRKVAGHDADAVYMAGLTRRGNQIVRASALALEGTPHADEARPALAAAWQRLVTEGRDNSHDARDAIARTLAGLDADPRGKSGGRGGRAAARPDAAEAATNDLNADDLRRLASPRARVTIRGVGTFELALFTAQAPATVLRFARLAESGYYNGLTFHRVVPNFVIQGGSPGANEFIGDASFMRDEVGIWPHVRGAVGISTRGHDTGDAQIFVDLVDNPRLDHQYTVFAQVLNGIDVVDQILEGDVIERIDIVP
jgi:cyclophilin family peptidyl-prolyl cis-trans isomerase/HEAT repeat protein